MTPSGWHDDARDRDAGHDEMQLEVWRALKEMKTAPCTIEDKLFDRTEVVVEYPFTSDGRIVGFADICEVWRAREHDYNGRYRLYYVAFEIKPKIYSAGALVRQCRALQHTVWGIRSRDDRRAPLCSVVPVVRASDPKLSLFREMWAARLWAWNADIEP